MKKILLITLMILVTGLFAQSKKITLDGALELGVPMGDFADVAGMGIGFSAKGYYDYSEKLDYTARIGYTYFGGKEFAGFDYSYAMIPIMVGAKYKFLESTPELYGSVEAGFNLVVWTYEYDFGFSFPGMDSNREESDSSMELTITPSIGYVWKTGEHTFDISAGMRLVDFGD